MPKLRFKNGKFRIMVVGDVHEKYPPDFKTEDTLRMINAMLDELAPDFAVIMGDIASDYRIEGRVSKRLTDEEMLEEMKMVFGPYAERGIPFGVVFGNHDDEKSYTKPELLEMIQRVGGCVITDTPGIMGCGNCNVTVKGSASDKDALNLWFIDSNSSVEDGGYDWVHSDQIVWYEKRCDELASENGGEVVPAILFQHIPVCEEYKLLKEVSVLNPNRVRGHGVHDDKFYVLDKSKATGYMGEGPCTPDINGCQFASWKKKGDVFAAFFGHDHQNDFIGTHDGIMLGQCKCSGFHIYGDGLRQGVRMITVDENNPRNIDTEMHYYREIFGTECNSIKGLDLLTDRTRQNLIAASIVVGSAAILTGAGLVASAAVKLIKGRK